MSPEEAARSMLSKWRDLWNTWCYQGMGTGHERDVLGKINVEWAAIDRAMQGKTSSIYCKAMGVPNMGWADFAMLVHGMLQALAKVDSPESAPETMKPFDWQKIPKRIEIRGGMTRFNETKW